MKYIIFAIVLIATLLTLHYQESKYDQMVFEYEQELRVQHEYLKACEGHRLYLAHTLEKNGIEFIK